MYIYPNTTHKHTHTLSNNKQEKKRNGKAKKRKKKKKPTHTQNRYSFVCVFFLIEDEVYMDGGCIKGQYV